MAITATASKIHWNYFLALERDLDLTARYVEFSTANMQTYSIEFAHLLLAAASEIDVIAKLLCEQLDSSAQRGNIDQYQSVFAQHLSSLASMQVFIPRYGLTLTPWSNWSSTTNPGWWRSYNDVKHQRDMHFQKATLKNVLNALGGLLCLNFHYYSYLGGIDGKPLCAKDTTRSLKPQSILMQFGDDFYNKVRITE